MAWAQSTYIPVIISMRTTNNTIIMELHIRFQLLHQLNQKIKVNAYVLFSLLWTTSSTYICKSQRIGMKNYIFIFVSFPAFAVCVCATHSAGEEVFSVKIVHNKNLMAFCVQVSPWWMRCTRWMNISLRSTHSIYLFAQSKHYCIVAFFSQALCSCHFHLANFLFSIAWFPDQINTFVLCTTIHAGIVRNIATHQTKTVRLKCHCDICPEYTCETDGLCFTSVESRRNEIIYSYR